jgi:photosystem II stability/assembly factor-like uncharacterized protein
MWETLPVTSTHEASAALEPEQLDAISSTELFALVRTGQGMNSPNGELLESRDGGRSWSVVSSTGSGLPASIGSISMQANWEGWLAAGSTTTTLRRLYRTTDGGKLRTTQADSRDFIISP